MTKAAQAGKTYRVGPMDRASAYGRLKVRDMSRDDILRVLDAADRSLDPVTYGLPWAVADVYASRIFGGYTIAFRRGVQPS